MAPDDSEFTSRSLALFIQTQFAKSTPCASTKLISNDLNRLYRMQLLSRKRTKRPIAGGGVYRGSMYAYRLNKQGRSYFNHLKKTYFHPEIQQYFQKFALRTNLQSVFGIEEIENNMGNKGDDLNETYAEYAHLFSRPKLGRSRRFPTRISFEFVKELMQKKQSLERENRALKAELKTLQLRLAMLMRRN